MNDKELIEEMTRTIEEAVRIQEQCETALTDLEEENKFLADTILQSKMGKIAEERRRLLSKAKQAEDKVWEAEKSREQYEQRMNGLVPLIREVTDKQQNLNEEIERKAENKITDKKKELSDLFEEKEKTLKKKYQKMESEINKKIIIVTVICVVLTIGNVLLWFVK